MQKVKLADAAIALDADILKICDLSFLQKHI